jgi:NitT/TauT family transport system ATP-binding protein
VHLAWRRPIAPAPADTHRGVHDVGKRHGTGRSVVALDQSLARRSSGRVPVHRRRERLRQVDAAQPDRRTRRASAGTVDVQGRVALMFQEAALLPWRTAAQNVELALKLRGVPRKPSGASEALELLRWCGLREFADKRPHELSGGMRQRVALARSLGQGADVLLMDEPFGALDAITRDVLHDELERVASEQRLSVVFVTHNVREASRLGDRIVLLTSRPGRVVGRVRVPVERPRRIESAEVSTIAADRHDSAARGGAPPCPLTSQRN